MNQNIKILLILCLIILSTKEAIASNNNLSTPPPGTKITKGNVILYINEVGEEVFLSYKSGKIKKKDIKVIKKGAIGKRIRGTRGISKSSTEELLSSAPKSTAIRKSYRQSRRNTKSAIEIAYLNRKRKELNPKEIVSKRVSTPTTKSKIKQNVKTDFTALKASKENTLQKRIQAKMKLNTKKYKTSRMKDDVKTDFSTLKKSLQHTHTQKINEKQNKQIARFLKDLDE